ncbi:hypothetical protein [Methylocapsa sp. S129]|uniref:hypothetical protein n=1 Tax=Methylocapsa sp. S129 TaxID=1641869 RepID=UPI00131BF3DB|nr:hypothetical protein [Methylocapsa sp. S129]
MRFFSPISVHVGIATLKDETTALEETRLVNIGQQEDISAHCASLVFWTSARMSVQAQLSARCDATRSQIRESILSLGLHRREAGASIISSKGAAQDSSGMDARGSRKDDVDAESDEKERQSRQPTYIAHVALDAADVQTEQELMPLEPGMAVTAEIKTGQRRVISDLLSPLIRYKQEGLRER